MTFSGFIPATETENPNNPAPRRGNCVPNVEMLLSPANQATTPPSLGIVLAISANDLAASAAAMTLSGLIPSTAIENPNNPAPRRGNCVPNVAILLSPANQAATPPSLGIVLAISVNDFAEFAAAVILSGLMPSTVVEKPNSPAPRRGNCLPNVAILLSPANQAATPPSLGIVSAIAVIALAASAAATTLSGFIPATETEKPNNPAPRRGNCSPNAAMLLSPANQAITPPSLGIVSAIAVIALAASVAACIEATSMPATESAYAFI